MIKNNLKLLLTLILVSFVWILIIESTKVESKNNSTRANCENNSFDNDEKKIFELINNERRKYKLDSLVWNSNLAELARNYSKKMAQENFFSHYDKSGNSLAERVKAMKINRWKRIGENLFMCGSCSNYPQLAIKGWMKSTGHRDNILEEKFNQTGIGIAKSTNGIIYVTQVFMQS